MSMISIQASKCEAQSNSGRALIEVKLKMFGGELRRAAANGWCDVARRLVRKDGVDVNAPDKVPSCPC